MTGVSPFLGNSVTEVLVSNRESEIEYPMEFWKNVSKEAIELVMKMTDSDQYNRPTAKQSLNHPWFSLTGLEKKFLNDVAHNLKKFDTENVGKRDRSPDAKDEGQFLTPNLLKRAMSNCKCRILPDNEEISDLLSTKRDRGRRGSLIGLFDTNNIGRGLLPIPDIKSSLTITQFNPFFSRFKPEEECKENEFKSEEFKEDEESEIPCEKPPTNDISLKILARSIIPSYYSSVNLTDMEASEGVSKHIFDSMI